MASKTKLLFQRLAEDLRRAWDERRPWSGVIAHPEGNWRVELFRERQVGAARPPVMDKFNSAVSDGEDEVAG